VWCGLGVALSPPTFTLAEWANLLFFGTFGVNGVDSVCGVTESVAARQLSFALVAFSVSVRGGEFTKHFIWKE